MDPWVIFDADNTLWATEALYDEARDALVAALVAHGIEPIRAEEAQQAIDKELYETFGYSAERFPASFERTLIHFLPNASNEDRLRVKGLAEQVFFRPAKAHQLLELIIEKLSNSYHLGILTAGEHWVQQQRLRHFAYSHHFNAVEIVSRKDASVFDRFADRYNVNRSLSWVVGDSLRSDIIPARLAGFNAILLSVRNWEQIEMNSLALPQGAHRVLDLSEILSIIPLTIN
ncbi:HAD family hydrolase [uncultured Bradyrhizobium sp.]|jgi:putative hydrolase of the HAD superfamily|uniref:HAD family hydrolase n=1 Tax=uncultured Bradyrhizobium sp. TaxID=199684 RepID=UPI002628998F|nr:HAD family hydrolase [uncultured Bradyrhizobium sp.]